MIPSLLASLALPTLAATLEVGPNGDYATIGEAIVAASPGDEIAIEAGVFTESVNAPADLTLTGAGSALTTVVGTIGPAVNVAEGTVTLSGLHLTGPAQGLRIRREGTVVSTDLAFDAGGPEGAVTVDGSLDLASATFTGGGIGTMAVVVGSSGRLVAEGLTVAGYQFGVETQGTATVRASTFSANTYALSAYGFTELEEVDFTGNGLAVWATDALVVTGGVFATNGDDDDGDGAALHVYYGDAVVEGATFQDNAGGNGGAIAVEQGSVSCTNCVFERNHSVWRGGAIFAQWPSYLSVTDSTFVDNASEDYGGAIHAVDGLSVVRTLFCRNSAVFDGGGIDASGLDDVLIANSVFAHNRARDGGGASLAGIDGQVTVGNSTFVANEANGGAALFSWAGNLRLVNTQVLDHPGVAVEVRDAPVDLDYVLWSGNDLNVSGTSRGAHDVDAAPDLVAWSADGDCSNDSFLLRPASPARDNGHPELAFLDRDGSVNDIGVTGGPYASTADTDVDGVPDISDRCPFAADAAQTDGDGDGFGDACDPCPGTPGDDADFDSDGTGDGCDCAPADPAHQIASPEMCNGVDDDCDGIVDGPSAGDAHTWYADADGDGRGDPDAPITACEPPGTGYATSADDCDDTDALISPLAKERPGNKVDDDCDGEVDEGDTGDKAPSKCGCTTHSGPVGLMWLGLTLGIVRRARHLPGRCNSRR